MKKREYDDDDGRTVADMSGIERQPLLLPRFRRRREKQLSSAGWGREERRAVLLGAMSASLAIALVFIAAGAVVIGILYVILR
ncbi:MAG: hypothetical protein IK116_00430 [Firmicutes bacterium]|nr:hypothetical protein [Bacillota bacterium]